MLTDFFKLNDPTDPKDEISRLNETELLEKIRQNETVENVIFEPATLAPRQGKDRTVRGITFRNVSFKGTTITNMTFTKCKFEDCLFIDTSIQDCWFEQCSFECANFYRARISGTYVEPSAFKKAFDKKEHSNIGVHLYDQLLQNFRQQQNLRFLPETEYRYMSWQTHRRMYHARTNKKFRKIIPFVHWIIGKLYSLTLGYGLKPLRFLVVSVLSFLILAGAIYGTRTHFGFSPNVSDIDETRFSTIAYFAAITVSTLGYGDLTPTTSLGMFVSASISIGGLIWFGVFTAMFAKRFIR